MKNINGYSFKDKRAIVRVDFNVPLNADFEVTDNTRIKGALPTINKIIGDGGSAILMSHLGRPKQGPEEKFSLKHVVSYLTDNLGVEVQFSADCIGAEAEEQSTALKAGEVLVLENLRFYKEETKGDVDFARKLSAHGDVWVNDAFGTAHRAHASTAVIAQFFDDKVCGYVIEAELENAKKVLKSGEKPLTAIMGGAKISDKILIIENLLDRVDNLLVGGGMAYTFFKAQGGFIYHGVDEPVDDLVVGESVLPAQVRSQKFVHLRVWWARIDLFIDALKEPGDFVAAQPLRLRDRQV